MSHCAVHVEMRTFPWAAGRLVAVDLSRASDEELLQRVAGDMDEAAFETLYSRYSRAVFAVVQRRLRDHAATEDVVQEAFASVWRAARGYRRERGPAAGWLFAIARNAAADAARARPLVTVGEPPDQPDPAAGPDAEVAAELEAFTVHAAVDSLPEREREVIELAYWGGLSQSEVAERLSLPLGTVKTRTRSGLARMAERLAAEGAVW